MMRVANAALVLLDATVPHRFCDAKLVLELMSYLGKAARITPEVESELRQSASGHKYAGLRALQLAGGWPMVTMALPLELKGEYRDFKRAAQQPGDPPAKHAGEITTVLMTAHLEADLVVIDDGFGKALARQKSLNRISTAQLSLEMVCDRALTVDEGFAVFDCSTDASVGRPRFDQALREWRARRVT